MTLKEERERLFDENFKCIASDAKDIIHFCDRLKQLTGIHTCNHLGMMYEYLPETYNGALQVEEESE